MTVDDNVKVFRRVIDELVVGANPATFDELVAPDFVEHEVVPGFQQGREGAKQLFSALHIAFPDLRVDIENVVAQDDIVVFRMTWRATQTGAFMGMPPTGKQVAWQVFDMVRVANGQIAEHWGLMDQLGLLQQLGVIPSAEPATT